MRTRSDIDVVSITRAVVTVPAYFSMAQKTETMEAARLAGFIDDIHLITEPAAGINWHFATHFIVCTKVCAGNVVLLVELHPKSYLHSLS